MKISLKDLKSFKSQTSPHSHINSLGLTTDTQTTGGLIAQHKARKALSFLKTSILKKTPLSKIFILLGKKGTGKTSLIVGLSKDLKNIPVNIINASELFSLNSTISENLTRSFRKTVSVEYKKFCKILIGEVVSFKNDELILKTESMESKYNIGESLSEKLIKFSICENDVLKINLENGKLEKLGRTKPKDDGFLSPNDRIIECPEGDIEELREEAQFVTLHDLDVINYTNGESSLFRENLCNIPEEIRVEVNNKVDEWISESVACLTPGILFIDDSKLLNEECYGFLNRFLEIKNSPIIVLATSSLENIPEDFLSRGLLVKTEEYSKNEFVEIISLRIKEENFKVSDDGLNRLGDIAKSTGIRYVLNILGVLSVYCKGRDVMVKDVEKIYGLLLDIGRISKY